MHLLYPIQALIQTLTSFTHPRKPSGESKPQSTLSLATKPGHLSDQIDGKMDLSVLPQLIAG